jgi:hypothetical protein
MLETINKIENLLKIVKEQFLEISAEEAMYKVSFDKWSKKEILGHLCDSALNNLQRFTEVQYQPKPYYVRTYKQNELVQANRYQDAPIEQILSLWLALNRQIIALMKYLTTETLNYELVTGDLQSRSLKWLMKDYSSHMEHHVAQILA